jgi:hypothetical protein
MVYMYVFVPCHLNRFHTFLFHYSPWSSNIWNVIFMWIIWNMNWLRATVICVICGFNRRWFRFCFLCTLLKVWNVCIRISTGFFIRLNEVAPIAPVGCAVSSLDNTRLWIMSTHHNSRLPLGLFLGRPNWTLSLSPDWRDLSSLADLSK